MNEYVNKTINYAFGVNSLTEEAKQFILAGYTKANREELIRVATKKKVLPVVGKVITEGEFGWWCESNSIQEFAKIVDCICSSDLEALGDNAYRLLKEKYSVSESYNTIIKHF